MKVILQQDIRGKGKRGQMIEVSDGYARNYMLPRKLAVEATADNVNTMRMNDKAMQEKRQREREEASAIAARMRDLTVTDGPDEVTAVVTTAAGNNNMSPEYLTHAIRQYLPQYEIPFSAYHRMNVFTSDGTPFR